MKKNVSRRTLALLSAGFLALTAQGAFTAGGFAFTKRVDTALLADPRPLAEPVARLRHGRKLKIEEVRGSWLRVSDEDKTGWIFAGNLSEQKPTETRGLDDLPVDASETSVTAAARPLAPAAADYGSRRGLVDARSDIEWLEQTSDAVTPAQVQTFLEEHKKGEFQP